MFCTKCGTRNSDTVPTCEHCGAPLKVSPLQPAGALKIPKPLGSTHIPAAPQISPAAQYTPPATTYAPPVAPQPTMPKVQPISAAPSLVVPNAAETPRISPAASYTPPAATYVPPTAPYTPPAATYAPPAVPYTPPATSYEAPTAPYMPPATEQPIPTEPWTPPSIPQPTPLASMPVETKKRKKSFAKPIAIVAAIVLVIGLAFGAYYFFLRTDLSDAQKEVALTFAEGYWNGDWEMIEDSTHPDMLNAEETSARQTIDQNRSAIENDGVKVGDFEVQDAEDIEGDEYSKLKSMVKNIYGMEISAAKAVAVEYSYNGEGKTMEVVLIEIDGQWYAL